MFSIFVVLCDQNSEVLKSEGITNPKSSLIHWKLIVKDFKFLLKFGFENIKNIIV